MIITFVNNTGSVISVIGLFRNSGRVEISLDFPDEFVVRK